MNQLSTPPPSPPVGAAPLLLVPRRRRRRAPLLGQILVEMGALSPGDLIRAVAMRAREDTLFGEILLANGMIDEDALARGLARQFGCGLADLDAAPPDSRLLHAVGVANCLRLGILPLRRVGAATLVATCRPERFHLIRQMLPASFGPALMLVAPESRLQRVLLQQGEAALAARAEERVEAPESCRHWDSRAMARLVAAGLIALLAGAIAAPRATLLALFGWAILALLTNSILKAAAAIANIRATRRDGLLFVSRRNRKQKAMLLPKISILVPLYREREIAGRLVRRLGRLNYPRELLDICLVLESDDRVTREALQAARLPRWMRQVQVPAGRLKTKPRALNYALDFCKGSIIGVYDAEDAPEPDQLFRVVRRFHERGPEVACLQGVLDFYNSRSNWLSRCFTIEYATWFRVVLPGLERLGFVIPLGGTTLFFRRAALEEIGGWDAHNVTEDADLGIRLARRGYRTELLPTLTEEEANCRVWPWIRQRSRWLKGYAITWAVHMRRPARLWRDLGAWRFLGVQLLFLGALSQFLLAPLLWSFWTLPLGVSHPLAGVLSPTALYLLAALFFMSELVTLLVGWLALAPGRHRGLWIWLPSLHLYFPLATIAAYKGLWELIAKPFYWDKTEHGRPGRIDPQARNAGHTDVPAPRSGAGGRSGQVPAPGKLPGVPGGTGAEAVMPPLLLSHPA